MGFKRKALFSLAFLGASLGFAQAQTISNIRAELPTVTAGQWTTGVVYLNAAAPATGVVVSLTATTGATVPASVTVPSGARLASFSIKTLDTYSGPITLTGKTGTVTRKTIMASNWYNNGSYGVWLERASLSSDAIQANGHSEEPNTLNNGDLRQLSYNGNLSVFTSQASNLVPNDRNRKRDVFLRDRNFGTTIRISQLGALEGNGDSYAPTISGDGKFVAFVTDATNLIVGDANGASDIVVYEVATGLITHVSRNGLIKANAASYQPSISSNGRYVAFASDASNLAAVDTNASTDIFWFDRTTGVTKRASVATGGGQADADSFYPSISENGRFLAFQSDASNLVTGDTNGLSDVFLIDTTTTTTSRVSVETAGTELDGYSYGPSISADGKKIVYRTYALPATDYPLDYGYGNFAAIRDLNTSKSYFLNQYEIGVNTDLDDLDMEETMISPNGRFVAFSFYDWTTGRIVDAGVIDLTRRDGNLYAAEVINGGSYYAGYYSNPSMSQDGRYVQFYTNDRGLGYGGDTNAKDDVYVADVFGQQIENITFSSSNYQILGGDSVAITVRLLQPAQAGGQGINLRSTVPGLTVPSNVIVPAGAYTVTFSATTTKTNTVSSGEVIATVKGRSSSSYTSVVPWKLELSSYKVGSTVAEVTGTIRTSNPAAADLTFNLQDDSSYVTLPESAVLRKGLSSVSFKVTLAQPAAFSGWHVLGATTYWSTPTGSIWLYQEAWLLVTVP